MNHSCVLCDEPGAAGEVAHQNDHASLLLHPDSAVAGHAMVAARRHVENFSDLMPDEQAGFTRLLVAAEQALLQLTGSERAILLKLGIQVPHLHVHIYPVRASLDRTAVMAIIEGRVREQRPDDFIERLRDRLHGAGLRLDGTRPPE